MYKKTKLPALYEWHRDLQAAINVAKNSNRRGSKQKIRWHMYRGFTAVEFTTRYGAYFCDESAETWLTAMSDAVDQLSEMRLLEEISKLRERIEDLKWPT